MRTITHRLFGATAAVAAVHYAPAWTPHGWHAGVLVVAAAATAGGRLSPDCDQHGLVRAADALLPDEALGASGPLKHRGIFHSYLLPAGALWWLTGAHLPGWGYAVALGVVVGWFSHLLGDLVFGEANARAGRSGPGIPMVLWYGYVGLGLKADGPIERLTAAALCGVLGWLLWTGWGLWPTVAAALFVAVGVAKGAIRPSRVVTA